MKRDLPFGEFTITGLPPIPPRLIAIINDVIPGGPWVIVGATLHDEGETTRIIAHYRHPDERELREATLFVT